MGIFSQTIVRLRAPQLADTGGSSTPQRDWPNATRATITQVSVQPVNTSETRDAGGVDVTAQWRVYSRRHVDIDVLAGDRVEWDGRTLDVVGDPQRWQALGSGRHHAEILLREQPLTVTSAAGVDAVLRDGLIGVAGQQQPWTP